MLNIVDEFTHECPASEAERKFKGYGVADVLRYLFMVRGCPEYIRSDNGSEFYSKAVKVVMDEFGVKPLFVKPASPWENGYVESFNARMRDELLDGEIFLMLVEVKYVVDRWRMDYNHYRPHSSLAYMTPAEFARLCIETDCRRTQRKPLDMSIRAIKFSVYGLLTSGVRNGADQSGKYWSACGSKTLQRHIRTCCQQCDVGKT